MNKGLKEALDRFVAKSGEVTGRIYLINALIVDINYYLDDGDIDTAKDRLWELEVVNSQLFEFINQ
jgi:hypothetical protein